MTDDLDAWEPNHRRRLETALRDIADHSDDPASRNIAAAALAVRWVGPAETTNWIPDRTRTPRETEVRRTQKGMLGEDRRERPIFPTNEPE